MSGFDGRGIDHDDLPAEKDSVVFDRAIVTTGDASNPNLVTPRGGTENLPKLFSLLLVELGWATERGFGLKFGHCNLDHFFDTRDHSIAIIFNDFSCVIGGKHFIFPSLPCEINNH